MNNPLKSEETKKSLYMNRLFKVDSNIQIIKGGTFNIHIITYKS